MQVSGSGQWSYDPKPSSNYPETLNHFSNWPWHLWNEFHPLFDSSDVLTLWSLLSTFVSWVNDPQRYIDCYDTPNHYDLRSKGLFHPVQMLESTSERSLNTQSVIQNHPAHNSTNSYPIGMNVGSFERPSWVLSDSVMIILAGVQAIAESIKKDDWWERWADYKVCYNVL